MFEAKRQLALRNPFVEHKDVEGRIAKGTARYGGMLYAYEISVHVKKDSQNNVSVWWVVCTNQAARRRNAHSKLEAVKAREGRMNFAEKLIDGFGEAKVQSYQDGILMRHLNAQEMMEIYDEYLEIEEPSNE